MRAAPEQVRLFSCLPEEPTDFVGGKVSEVTNGDNGAIIIWNFVGSGEPKWKTIFPWP